MASECVLFAQTAQAGIAGGAQMHTAQGVRGAMLDHMQTIDNEDTISTYNPDVDQAAAARLKRARIEAGYRTAVEFARKLGINMTTYHHHENGRRNIPEDVARHYANALDLDFSSLLFGDELRKVASVPIVGVIHGRGEITLMKDTSSDLCAALSSGDEAQKNWAESPGQTLQKIHVPDFSRMEALIVRDNELWPAYRIDDVVFFYTLVRIERGGMPPEWHGVECVCLLKDGRRLLRQVFVQQDGGVTLVGYATVPPMINAPIIAASPVEWVRRHYRRPD